jgi:hypothetical protein
MKTEDPSKKLVCLFGSGISIPAGKPSTAALSQELLPPKRFFDHSNDTWTLDDPLLGHGRCRRLKLDIGYA